MSNREQQVIPFEDLMRTDTEVVGGKNSSLGEMVRALGQKGIKVPPGFATTADAFRNFITQNELDLKIGHDLERLA